ncbi:zinc finger protein 37-like [Strongylocentrotus purpuratus]|uniref:C2H2-type domain-containing protein n=1 Tax=Strongylocentrotus purpuratus TaxID=7668 RepID=A0A7M7PLX6_STRPU|nr:zinc finger protein 37-like [Strongylocentrotus purpuratus]
MALSKDAIPMWDMVSPEDDKALMEKFTAESNKVSNSWSLGSASSLEKDAAVSFLVQLGAVQIAIQCDSQQIASQKQVSIHFGDEQHIETEHGALQPVQTKDNVPIREKSVTPATVSQHQDSKEVQIDYDDDEDNSYAAWMTEPDDGDDDDTQTSDTAKVIESSCPSATLQPREEHPCPDCHVILHSTWDLDLHKLHDCTESNNSIQYVYNCDQCRKSFHRWALTVVHLRKVHNYNMTHSETIKKLDELKSTKRQKSGKKDEKCLPSEKKALRRPGLGEAKRKTTRKKVAGRKKRENGDMQEVKKQTTRKKVARRKKRDNGDMQEVKKQTKSDRRNAPRLSKRLCIRLNKDVIKILESEGDDENNLTTNYMIIKPERTAGVSNVEKAQQRHTSDEHQNLNFKTEASGGKLATGRLNNEPQGQGNTAEQVEEKGEEDLILMKEVELVIEDGEKETSATMPMPESEISEAELEEETGNTLISQRDEGQGQAAEAVEENQDASADPIMEKKRKIQTADLKVHESQEGTSEPRDMIEHKASHETAERETKEASNLDADDDENNFTTIQKSTENAIVCSLCDLQFETKQDRNKHMPSHKEHRLQYKCSTCGKTFNAKVTYRTHVETHQDKTKRQKYHCKTCDKTYLSKYTYNNHMDSHVGKSKLFKCDTCGKTCASKSYLEYHINTIHIKEIKYTCEVCGQRFYDTRRIKSHVESHKERAFKCEECGKGFIRAYQLKNHKKTVHSNAGHCLCEVCGSAFKSQGNLKQHNLTVHTDVYKYSCNVCGKKFKRTSLRNSHMKIHSNDPANKPFKCELCRKAFASQDKLKVHMNWHYNIRSFTCDLCGKSFLTKGNLVKHQYVHKDKKPHECQICSRGFMDLPGLRKHLDVIHKITLKKVVTQRVLEANDAKESGGDGVPARKPAATPSSPSNSGTEDTDNDSPDFKRGKLAQVSEASDGQVVREALLAMMNL